MKPETSCAYFLIISPNEEGGRRFVRLKAPTVLAWFQRAWRATQKGDDWAQDLRGEVYGLERFFDAIDAENLDFPEKGSDLVSLLEQHVYTEKDIEAEPHFVHVETNDDEVDIEYFFFDDEFLKSREALDRLPSAAPPPSGWNDEDDEVEELGHEEEGDAYAAFIAKLIDDE